MQYSEVNRCYEAKTYIIEMLECGYLKDWSIVVHVEFDALVVL